MTTYPGARWWKFDFHTHTPASSDYGKGQNQETLRRITPEEWLLDYMRAGIDCVAVTDHNSGEWIDKLKAALSKLETEKPADFRLLYLSPGVEITANSGVHVLAIFDPSKTTKDITQLLGAVHYRGTHGESARAADYSVIQVIEEIDRAGASPQLAHVDGANGAFNKVFNGNTLDPILTCGKLFAIEVCDSDALKPELYTQKNLQWAEVLGSDSHHRAGNAGQRFPGSHFTWVKMGSPSIEGLKLALLDPSLDGAPLSVRRSDRYPDEQNKVPERWIEKIEVQNARFMGRGQALTAPLNPWLNAVVGGRGTGKSSLIEFVRLVLQREQQLPAKLSAEFTDFARSPKSRDDKGALMADTVLCLTYRKGVARFRINWTASGGSVIEEQQADESYRVVPGDIRQRFPVRIFSQKQVFAMANELQALLGIIDETSEVAKANWQQKWNEELSRFLSLRAKQRELQVRLKERPTVEGELADLARKLSVFEGAAHAKTLKDFQRRQRQKRGIDETAEELARVQQQLSALSAGLAITNIDRGLFDAADPADAGMLALLDEAARKAGEFAGAVAKLADGAKGFHDTWIERVSRSDWKKHADQARTGYDTLVTQLRGQGVTDPAQYGALVQQRQVLEQKFKSLNELKAQIESLEQQAHASVKRLDEQRTFLTESRRGFLQQSLSNNPHVRIEVQPFGRDVRETERSFRQVIEREDASLTADILSEDQQSGLIAELYRDLPKSAAQSASEIKTRVNALKNRLLDVANGKDESSIGKVFTRHLRQLKPESLDRLQTWFPEDGLAVSYRTGSGQSDFRPIEQGSPGQKTAAVLAFLLSHGTEPMLLDQPEDDLDNHLVYDLIVTQLRDNKQRRQLLVVTHNPNIVVNGDAELVLPMDHKSGQCVFVTPPGPGSLQSLAVREEVCRVMEGGRKAFEQRYRRIMLEGHHV